MNPGVFVGHYFRILAFVSLLALPVSLLMGKGPSIDLSFILLFWVGRGLVQFREKVRKVAVWICGVCVALATGGIVQALISSEGPSLKVQGGVVTTALAVFACGRILLLFLPAYVLLLLPVTRHAYRVHTESEPATDNPWTGRSTAYHVLGAAVLIAFGISSEYSRGKTSISRTSSFLRYGEAAIRCSVLTHFRDETSKTTLFVSSWVLGEHNSTADNGGSARSGAAELRIGPFEVHPPDPRPSHYLRGVDSFPEPLNQANILIVRADGRIIIVPRRVSATTIAQAEKVIEGSKDFDDIQRRIEALLPPLPPP